MKKAIVYAVLVLITCGVCSSCRSVDSVVEHSVAAVYGIYGTWKYDGASVEAKSSNVLSKVAKPVAKSKLKKKLNNAFKKIKINKKTTQITFRADGTYSLRLFGPEMSGKYEYDAVEGIVTLRWHGVPVKARVKRESNKLHLLFNTDRLLHLMELASGLSSNKTLQSLAFLAENYNDVEVGFCFKK